MLAWRPRWRSAASDSRRRRLLVAASMGNAGVTGPKTTSPKWSPVRTSELCPTAPCQAPLPMTPPLPRAFNTLAVANLAAQAAEQVSLAAVPIVAVLALNAGPGQIGLLNTAQSLPFLLLAIPLGLWADRHSRRRLMVTAETLRALSLALLLWAVASGRLSIALLAALGFAGASGTVGFSVAAPALVPALVPLDQRCRVLSIRCRPDPVDHQLDHIAPDRDANGHAGPGVGHLPDGQHGRTAAGCGAGRCGR